MDYPLIILWYPGLTFQEGDPNSERLSLGFQLSRFLSRRGTVCLLPLTSAQITVHYGRLADKGIDFLKNVSTVQRVALSTPPWTVDSKFKSALWVCPSQVTGCISCSWHGKQWTRSRVHPGSSVRSRRRSSRKQDWRERTSMNPKSAGENRDIWTKGSIQKAYFLHYRSEAHMGCRTRDRNTYSMAQEWN